jgi:hypothetical protein
VEAWRGGERLGGSEGGGGGWERERDGEGGGDVRALRHGEGEIHAAARLAGRGREAAAAARTHRRRRGWVACLRRDTAASRGFVGAVGLVGNDLTRGDACPALLLLLLRRV